MKAALLVFVLLATAQAAEIPAAHWRVRAEVLVIRVPQRDGIALASRWADATILAATIQSAELLTLAPREVLRRLFHELDLRVFDERVPRYRCSCSRDRVADMLRMLGQDEVRDILEKQGRVSVNCEFCDKAYPFDAIDAAQLFTAQRHDGSALKH